MPAGAPLAKIAAVRHHGGEVRLVEGSFDEAQDAARACAEEGGLTLVHAFDDPAVVAGQGTIGLEIARQAPETRSDRGAARGRRACRGFGIAAAARLSGVRVVGVQAEAVRRIRRRWRHTGRGASSANTICDGIAVKRPGEVTLPLVERYVDEVVTVTDDEVAEAMVLLLERSKLVVEGAGAVGVAALLQGHVEPPADGDVCVVLSGGNVDASLLAECIRMGETAAGRRVVLSTTVPDRPGGLASLLSVIAARAGTSSMSSTCATASTCHVRETAVQLVVQTRGPEHGEEILGAVRAEGFVRSR